ncbi:hypothetical protein SynMEDNS5_00641 [Synechococcus sp. MEDNS5]|nr:hypothetical protein SynMEDNS5_00641 [Synechococcus sp. MEDNS5]
MRFLGCRRRQMDGQQRAKRQRLRWNPPHSFRVTLFKLRGFGSVGFVG